MNLAYTPFKIFHYPDTLSSMSSATGITVAPIHVRIKPINLCNHHCWYCAYKAEDMQLGEDMDQKDQIPEDKMTEIVEDLVNIGCQSGYLQRRWRAFSLQTTSQSLKKTNRWRYPNRIFNKRL